MSSDRSGPGRPLKSTFNSDRVTRTPLAPRLAANPTSAIPTASRRTGTVRSEPATLTPRARQQPPPQDETPVKEPLSVGNITPRSSARKSKSRVESASSTPSQAGDSPNLLRPRSNVGTYGRSADRSSGSSGLGISGGYQSKARSNRPKSLVSDSGIGTIRGQSPLTRTSGPFDTSRPRYEESTDSRFFHASEATKQEPVPKRPEPKKTSAFFYANGQQEERSPRAPSPVLSAVSDNRSSGPWIRHETSSAPRKSPPLLSPALSSISSSSPFFAPPAQGQPRSSSPNKDSIHLSYRKGASQIFGSRPSPIPTPRNSDGQSSSGTERRSSLEPNAPLPVPHRKSPSLSSIDSGTSQQSRRRSATTLDPVSSPLSTETRAATIPRLAFDTLPFLESTLSASPLPSTDVPAAPALDPPMSPTKALAELAADARRERKVLDLEISNSSLLAINASLEREVRRQKAELKRFRRLSRAGHFPQDRTARLSEGLSTLGEEEEGATDYAAFGPPSGFTDIYDDFSEEEDGSESIVSDTERDDDSSDPDSRESLDNDRLARDENRLRVDLEKHKELLVQSQMMNQSLKRCVYTTEAMIREGRKALDYHVRVSDVKLGGRILTGHEEEEENLDADATPGTDIEVEDDTLHEDSISIEQAKGFLDVWTGLGNDSNSQRVGFEGSEGGDRDSGIEVDKPLHGFGRPLLEPDPAAERPGLRWAHSIS